MTKPTYTIAHLREDGTMETEHTYEKESTASLAAIWRSNKRQENWFVLEIEDAKP